MTVKELIAKLNECDPADQVLVAHDPEGNGYRRVADVTSDLCFDTDGPEYVDVGLSKLTDEDRQQGFTDSDVMAGGAPCVVLWPGYKQQGQP